MRASSYRSSYQIYLTNCGDTILKNLLRNIAIAFYSFTLLFIGSSYQLYFGKHENFEAKNTTASNIVDENIQSSNDHATQFSCAPKGIAIDDDTSIHEYAKKVKALSRLREDPSYYYELFELLKSDPSNQDLVDDVYELFSETRAEEVTFFAQELLDSNIDEQQEIGLELLAELTLSNPTIIDSVINIIWRSNNNPKLLSLAIKSIPSSIEHRKPEVINTLESLISHTSNSVRNNSFSKMAELAESGSELKSAIDAYSAFGNDEELQVALAIKRSSILDENIKSILIDFLLDDDRSPAVRRLSFEALKRFHLNESEFGKVHNYRG